jgi:OmpA-OmpF porin, OOP family
MRKHKNGFRVASLAAPMAMALMMAAPIGVKADAMETFWAAPPNESAWVNSVGECWQGADGDSNLPPCAAAPAAPLVLRLLFELDKYRLENIRNPEVLQELDDYIANVKQTPQDEKLTIVGHTDKLGSWEHNVVLSENRADTIRDYMVERGISPSSIQSVTGKAWEGGDDVAADGSIIDLGPLENNPLRRRVVVTAVAPETAQ